MEESSTQTAPIRVLLAEDNPADAECTARALAQTARPQFELSWVQHLAEALESARTGHFDVMLLDLGLPGYSGLEALQEVRGSHHELPIVVLTGVHDEAAALKALDEGAQDYLVKGRLSADSLWLSIRYAIQRQQLLAATTAGKLEAEARAKLAAIVEFSDEAIFSETLDGIISSWNQGAERMFGYSAEEILGRSVSIIFPPEGTDEFQRILAAARRGEPLRQFDTQRVRKDKQRIHISLSVSPIKDDDGKITGIAKIARDISERKRSEAALDERVHLATLAADVGVILTRRDSLQTMLQSCAEALTKQLGAAFARIWTLNATQNVLELQASAGMYAHLNGRHSRVPVGQLKIGLIAQQRQPHLTNEVIGDPRVGDQEWAKREGMVAFAGYPLICEDHLVGVVAMFSRQRLSGVTLKAIEAVADGIAMGIERYRVAEELRASEERFELAVRGSTDGLWDWNILTDDTYMSPRINEMLGYKEDELEQRLSSWLTWLHPDDREATWALVQRAIEEHTQFVTEYRLRTRSGEYRWFLARGQALWDANGKAYRMAGSVTDITERKQMEAQLAERDKQLRQAQKLEAVGSLAGGIAHEFNNLLQAILGYTRLAMEGLPGDGQPFQDLEQVNKAADRASTLTRQLLGFSRHQVLDPVPLDPRSIVSDLVKMLRPLIGEQIDVEVLPTTQVNTLYADACLLQQMLLNLCINARDAMPAGGRLVLKTEQVDLSAEYSLLHPPIKPGAYVLFSVADTGCGMSPEVKDRIFEPFFTTKEVGSGTGLGLAMVYGVVQQHGGIINVYSELGVGTTFKIYLPITVAGKSNLSEESPDPARGGSQTILIAEDDTMVRDLTVRILKRAGYSLLIAADGAEAIELFEAYADVISLALLDAIMPKCTGREVHDRIKLRKPDLPVVFCSGYDPDTGQVRFLRDHGLRLVRKPFDPETLLRTLREALDAQQLRDTAPCLT